MGVDQGSTFHGDPSLLGHIDVKSGKHTFGQAGISIYIYPLRQNGIECKGTLRDNGRCGNSASIVIHTIDPLDHNQHVDPFCNNHLAQNLFSLLQAM